MSQFEYYPTAPGSLYPGANVNEAINAYLTVNKNMAEFPVESDWPVPLAPPGYYDAQLRTVFQLFGMAGVIHDHLYHWKERGNQTECTSFESLLFRISWDNPNAYGGYFPKYWSSRWDSQVTQVRDCSSYSLAPAHSNTFLTLPIPALWTDIIPGLSRTYEDGEREVIESTAAYDAGQNTTFLTFRWHRPVYGYALGTFETAIPATPQLTTMLIPVIIGCGLLSLLLMGNAPTPARPRKR